MVKDGCGACNALGMHDAAWGLGAWTSEVWGMPYCPRARGAAAALARVRAGELTGIVLDHPTVIVPGWWLVEAKRQSVLRAS